MKLIHDNKTEYLLLVPEKRDVLRQRDRRSDVQDGADEPVPAQHRRYLQQQCADRVRRCAADGSGLSRGLRDDKSALRQKIIDHAHE